MVMIHIQKLKFENQSVQKIKWKQTDGQTDRQTDGQTDTTDCVTFPVNAVGKKVRT